MYDKLNPAGFKELYECFAEIPADGDRVLTTEEIQKRMRAKYAFTSGQVAGTIDRAVEQLMIQRLKRGFYKLNEDFLETDAAAGFMGQVNGIVQKAINDIKALTLHEIAAAAGNPATNGQDIFAHPTIDTQKVSQKIKLLQDTISI